MTKKKLSMDHLAPSLVDWHNWIIQGDNLAILKILPREMFSLIYIDPPFNTGSTQTRQTTKMVKSANGT